MKDLIIEKREVEIEIERNSLEQSYLALKRKTLVYNTMCDNAHDEKSISIHCTHDYYNVISQSRKWKCFG